MTTTLATRDPQQQTAAQPAPADPVTTPAPVALPRPRVVIHLLGGGYTVTIPVRLAGLAYAVAVWYERGDDLGCADVDVWPLPAAVADTPAVVLLAATAAHQRAHTGADAWSRRIWAECAARCDVWAAGFAAALEQDGW